jgi:hypothetical protein
MVIFIFSFRVNGNSEHNKCKYAPVDRSRSLIVLDGALFKIARSPQHNVTDPGASPPKKLSTALSLLSF